MLGIAREQLQPCKLGPGRAVARYAFLEVHGGHLACLSRLAYLPSLTSSGKLGKLKHVLRTPTGLILLLFLSFPYLPGTNCRIRLVISHIGITFA